MTTAHSSQVLLLCCPDALLVCGLCCASALYQLQSLQRMSGKVQLVFPLPQPVSISAMPDLDWLFFVLWQVLGVALQVDHSSVSAVAVFRSALR